jgi:hypothetical protein
LSASLTGIVVLDLCYHFERDDLCLTGLFSAQFAVYLAVGYGINGHLKRTARM